MTADADLVGLVIIGAGGFGREVADVAQAREGATASMRLLGFVDDGTPDDTLLRRQGVPLLGTTAELARWSTSRFVVAIADPAVRRRLDAVALAAGLEPASLLHPTAVLGSDLRLGPGLIMAAHTSITTNVDVGRHVHMDRNVTVGHDSTLGDYVTLHPGATLSGNVTVGDGATIGSNAVVLPGVSLGAGVTVGAGAAVLSDVGDGETVAGVPARRLRR